jgi:hypothetical protein
LLPSLHERKGCSIEDVKNNLQPTYQTALTGHIARKPITVDDLEKLRQDIIDPENDGPPLGWHPESTSPHTPLTHYVFWRSTEIAMLLLEMGADVN